MVEIKKNGLRVYELPPCDEDEDESFKAKDKQMKASNNNDFYFRELWW